MTTKQTKQEKGTGASAKPAGQSAAATPSRFAALLRYFEDARSELSKISWPTVKEVRVTSFAVLVLVVLMSIFLGLADFVFANLVDAILTRGGTQ